MRDRPRRQLTRSAQDLRPDGVTRRDNPGTVPSVISRADFAGFAVLTAWSVSFAMRVLSRGAFVGQGLFGRRLPLTTTCHRGARYLCDIVGPTSRLDVELGSQ